MRRSRSRDGGSLQRYLGANERILLQTRQHPLAIVGSLFEALLLIVPMSMIAWGVRGVEPLRNELGDWIVAVLFVAMILVVLRLLWRIVGWELERVVVTNQKVIHIHGVFSRRIASTPLVKVSELTVNQPLPGRLFGYGALVVDVPGGREQALHGLGYIPDPTDLYRLITDVGRADSRGQTVTGYDGQEAQTTVLRVDHTA
jgi:membrane protein YdbS with pleckstrin-like domain